MILHLWFQFGWLKTTTSTQNMVDRNNRLFCQSLIFLLTSVDLITTSSGSTQCSVIIPTLLRQSTWLECAEIGHKNGWHCT